MRKTDISVLNVGINYLEVQRGVINVRPQLISIELVWEATDCHALAPIHTSTHLNKSRKTLFITPETALCRQMETRKEALQECEGRTVWIS